MAGTARRHGRAGGTGGRAAGLAIRWTLAAFVVVAGAGLAVAILVAESDVWALPTLSQLSADPEAGRPFRVTMLVVGVIGLVLAGQVVRLLGRLRAAGQIGPRWVPLYELAFWVVPLGFLGVAVFPLGVGPLVELAHGTAAYAIPIAVLVLLLTARLAIPTLGPAFGRASLAVIAIVLLLYVAAVGGGISFALMEAIGFGLGAAWFVAFVERLVRLDDLEPA